MYSKSRDKTLRNFGPTWLEVILPRLSFTALLHSILEAMKAADRQESAYKQCTYYHRAQDHFQQAGTRSQAVFPLREPTGHFAAKRKVSEWVIYFTEVYDSSCSVYMKFLFYSHYEYELSLYLKVS